MTAPTVRDVSQHSALAGIEVLVCPGRGEKPRHPPAYRFNPDWDPAGIWNIHPADTDTGSNNGVDEPETQGELL